MFQIHKKYLTKYLTVPIVATGAASLKFAMDFNASMARVATLVPGNRKRIDELKESVLDLAIATGEEPGGLAAGLVRFPDDLLGAVRYANVVAGLSTEAVGTSPSMPSRADVDRRLDSG